MQKYTLIDDRKLVSLHVRQCSKTTWRMTKWFNISNFFFVLEKWFSMIENMQIFSSLFLLAKREKSTTFNDVAYKNQSQSPYREKG